MMKPNIFIAFVVAAAVALAAGCTKKSQRAGPPAVPVIAADAVSMDVPVELTSIGTVEAFNSVAVTARASGQLMRVGLNEGQDVKKGDFLFQIDPAPYQATLDQAQANLERDRARLVSAEADGARYAELIKKGYVTQEEYDGVASTAAAAKATVQADDAAARGARLSLDYCTILAPIAGRTGSLLVKSGNMVTPSISNPLVTINQMVPIYVRFTIPEQQLPQIRRYAQEGTLAVEASIPSDSTKVVGGKLTFINNTVDRETGTVLLKATFPNENMALWPGQFVQVVLVLTTQASATVVPAAAVQPSQQGDYIYVIKPDSTAELRSVVQGVKLDDKVVILKGVQPGERVVTDGQLRLVPGAKVAVKTGLVPGTPGGPPAAGRGEASPGGATAR